MTKEVKEFIRESERYKDFIILKNPIKFNEMYKNIDVDVVQIHSLETFENHYGGKVIAGFCGVCSWIDNELKSLDGDCYSDNMLVYGFSWFNLENQKIGLDILVEEW